MPEILRKIQENKNLIYKMGNAVVTRSEMNQGSSRVMVTHISSPFPLQGLA